MRGEWVAPRRRPLSYSTVSLIRHPVGDARDAVFDERNVEIDEQPQTFIRQPQVSQELFLVYGRNHTRPT